MRNHRQPYQGGGQRRPSGRRKKRSSAPLVLVGLVLIIAVSLGIAWLWQESQEKQEDDSAAVPSLQESSEASQKSTKEENPQSTGEKYSKELLESTTPSEEEEKSSAEESSQESHEDTEENTEENTDNPGNTASNSGDTSVSTYTRREEFSYALGQNSAPVDNSYFDDAIFFGDSISTGIPLYLYPVLGDTPVLAETGIAPYNALTRELFPVDGVKKTMLQAASSYGERSKVYILMGGNSLGADKETFIKGYREFLTAVKEQYPTATIYVQSMTPVTTTVTNTYPNLGTGNINVKIHDYNLSIMALAQELGVHYLDIASVFVDADGNLPQEASPSDGMHFGSDYYYRWYEYLRNHTA